MNETKNDYIEEIISKKNIKKVLIYTLVILIVIVISIKQGIKENENVLIYILPIILVLTLIILLSLSYYLGIYKKKKFILRRDEILQNGIHVTGNIISKKRIYYKTDSQGNRYHHYYVIVKLNKNNQDITINSPWLSFDPDYISSDLVDVYMYNDEYYITNYRIDNEEMQKDILNDKKYQNNTILLILLMVPLFLILVSLSIKGKITPTTFGVIFIGSFLGIAIYSTIKRFKGED